MSHEPNVKRTAALVVVLIAVLSGITPAQTPATAGGSSTISGEVLIKGQPAPNVRVSLLSFKVGEQPVSVARTATDSDGKFLFTSVTAGNYIVKAALPAYSFEIPESAGIGPQVSVGNGDTVDGIKLRMVKGGVITGKVTDPEGRPAIGGERIELQRVGPNRQQMMLNVSSQYNRGTDDRGIYRIYGLPSGNYLVSTGSEGIQNQVGSRKLYSRVFYDKKTKVGEADIVKVTEGTETTDIDFKFGEQPDSYTIAGKILSASGQPAPGVRLMIAVKRERMGTSGGPEMSGPDGAFSFSRIVPGTYSLFTWSDEGVEDYAEPVEVDVASSDVSGVELRLKKGGSIAGSIAIEGTSDPKVIASLSKASVYGYTASNPISTPSSVRAQVDSKGSFRLTGIRPGTIRLDIMGFQGNYGYVRRRIERDGVVVDAPSSNASGIEIKAGEQISGVRIVVQYGSGIIRGRTVITAGELSAASRVQVSVFRFEPSMGQYIPDGPSYTSTGTFQFENLVAGQYEVRAFVFQDNPTSLIRQPPLTFKSSPITVTNDKTEQVTIELDLTSKARQ